VCIDRVLLIAYTIHTRVQKSDQITMKVKTDMYATTNIRSSSVLHTQEQDIFYKWNVLVIRDPGKLTEIVKPCRNYSLCIRCYTKFLK